MDRRAVEVRTRGRVLRVRLSRWLQDRHQTARGGLRCEVREQRPLGLEGDRSPDQDEQLAGDDAAWRDIEPRPRDPRPTWRDPRRRAAARLSMQRYRS